MMSSLLYMTGWCDEMNDAVVVAEASHWDDPLEGHPPPTSPIPVADSDFEMTPTEVRVAAGTSAYLSCKPRSLRNKTVIGQFQRNTCISRLYLSH